MSSTVTATSTTQASPAYVETTVNYFPKEGGTTTYTPGSAGFYKRKFTPTAVRVHDIRGKEADFTLEKQGFQVVRHRSEQGDFGDEARIKAFYFDETEELIKRVAGATKVKGFSHEVRSAELSSIMNRIEQEQVKNDEMIYKSPPALYAHIDNSPSLAQTLFQRIFGAEEAERLRGSRWAIINAWRPIKPVGRDPLGCCDTATVLDDDLVSVYARPSASWGNSVKDFTGQEVEIYNVKANPLHKWYFASDMQPDEVLLITNYDTNKSVDGHPLRVVHSALPYARDERAPPRESIELRALVVWEDQRAEES